MLVDDFTIRCANAYPNRHSNLTNHNPNHTNRTNPKPTNPNPIWAS